MPLSGKWLEKARAPNPNQTTEHIVDKEHGSYEKYEPTEPPVWEAPAYEAVAPAPGVVGDEWVTNVPGLVIPEPPPDHGYAPGHNRDDGARDGRNASDVRFQFSDERYEADVFDGFPGSVSHVSDAALRRGRNAEGENNPPSASYGGEGFRRGVYRQWNLLRNFSPPWRRHDERIVMPATVTAIGDSPPPVNAGPNNSPFSSLARTMRRDRRPELRRVPEPVDEAVMSDGSTSQSVYQETWVL